MKISLQVLLLAATATGGHAAADKIPIDHECFVEYDSVSNKYKTYGAMCDTGLDCNYNIQDTGSMTGPIPGICQGEQCLGSNKKNPPAEGTSRVTICHRTCAENNPWVRITIDENGWSEDGGCGHGPLHDIWDECSGKDHTKWGQHHSDYIIKRHGTRAEVRAQLEVNMGLAPGTLDASSTVEHDYWADWEPACPWVRNGQCCDWVRGDCCGDDPNPVPPKIAGAGGDPHIKRWDRKNIDFHGECDLVLLHSEEIGLDDRMLDVHIRTKITDHWSSIESAAMKVGSFHLQVDTDKIWLPGTDGNLAVYTGTFPYTENDVTILAPSTDGTITNYTVEVSHYTHFDNTTNVVMSTILFQTVGAFLNIRVEGQKYDFGTTASGLVGDWELGKARDRSGNRFQTLGNEFFFEWQVNANDPPLFATKRFPDGTKSPPEPCVMPAVSSPTRRLRANVDKELYAAAMEACANKVEYDNCVDDIVFTGEVALHMFHD